MKQNNEEIIRNIKLIFKVYKEGEVIKELIPHLNSLNKLTIKFVNDTFISKCLRVENKNGSVPAAFIIEPMPCTVEAPFVKIPSNKKFSLILDLDETLIHFSMNNSKENKGTLSLRPGIFEFLDKLSKYYELMVFTAATNDYADPIIDAIERNKKYFDYRFYRQHASIINNDFVKDITKLEEI